MNETIDVGRRMIEQQVSRQIFMLLDELVLIST